MSFWSIFKKFVNIFKKEKVEYEYLPYSNYELVVKQKNRVDPLLDGYKTVGVICPHCKTRLEAMEREGKYWCSQCGQEMELLAGVLICKVFCERHGYPIEESEKAEGE